MCTNEQEGPDVLGVHLISLFETELLQKRFNQFVTDPLKDGELPEEIPPEFKLILV